jgi:hypothetical protein
MPHLLAPVTLGAATSGTFLLAQLSAETKIPLGEALAGFVFIAGLVWWLAKKLQRIEDDIRSVKSDLNSRPCQLRGECKLPEEKDAAD